MRLSDGKYKRTKLTVMRTAKTAAEYKNGMGGLPKTPGRSQKPITLPAMPWDKDDKSNNTPASNDGK